MLSPSLDQADPEDEKNDPHYSPAAAKVLREVYAERRGSLFPNFHRLLPFLNEEISERQRMRIQFVVGASLPFKDGRSAFPKAIQYLEDAAYIALDLRDARVFVDICERLAFIHYIGGSSESAINYYLNALEELDRADSETDKPIITSTSPVEMRLDLLWGLITQYFLLAKFDEYRFYVGLAREVAQTLTAPNRRVASIEWTDALVSQFKHKAEKAHKQSHEALRLFMPFAADRPMEHGRLLRVVASINLDLAAAPEGRERRKELLAEAGDYISRALVLATATGNPTEPMDRPGYAMALVDHVRYLRMSGMSSHDDDLMDLGAGRGVEADTSDVEHRRYLMSRAYQIALELNDRVIKCMVLTAEGDEYLATGPEYLQEALDLYTAALEAISTSDAAVYGMRAQEMLLRYAGKLRA